MNWKFELDGVIIDEPIGFDSFAISIQRDEKWHGVFIEASASPLGFYGAAHRTIKAAKESYGVDANIIFTASVQCDGEDGYREAISGKLNFAQYQERCGNECIIRIPVEQSTCAMVFKNRFDQKVNIDSNIAFDKQTLLQNYTGLGITMPLATQIIPISADADVSPDSDITLLEDIDFSNAGDPESTNLLVRPSYAVVTDNSILTGELDNPFGIYQPPGDYFLLTPQVLLEENPSCINTVFDYDIRMKGNIRMEITFIGPAAPVFLGFWSIVDYWDGSGLHWDTTGPGIGTAIGVEFDEISARVEYFTGVYNIPFDEIYSGTVALPPGTGLYAYLKAVFDTGIGGSMTADFTFTFDPETHFLLSTVKDCPPTDCDVYLINETLGRMTESITDRCLTVRSEYYGRIDSEPYEFDNDGCGGLRILTPGLKIRQATDKDFFASMEEVMNGLRAIDNIGMGMEANTVTNSGEWLRIEPVEHFYQNIKLLTVDAIPEAQSDIEEMYIYSNIKSGYNNWEIKSIKGIDEFCSYKERRTGIKSINNELDITTDLIASGYIIENLRTSTLVNTGQTDNTYDNDVFIICVERGGYNFIVEQGITDNAANFYSPATAYNWRIRPLYNLMRWFKCIVQCYVNISSTTSKVFFTSGKGNYLAEGNINAADNCRLENKVLAENHDLSKNDFDNVSEATPIYRPEIIQFDYPLSINDYIALKANPYGFIEFQCGNGSFDNGFIKSITYTPATGVATFTLLKKWL